MTRLLEWTFKNRLTVLVMFAVGSVIGLYAVSVTPVDAVPDITPNQVLVLTKAPSLSPLEGEKFLTFPVESSMPRNNAGILHQNRSSVR